MSQESNVSSIDPYSLPVEDGTIEENPGKTEDHGSPVDPEAAQTPATTTPTSNPQTTAMAITTTTQSVATTTTPSNIQHPIAIAHQASEPDTEAKSAIPVPGLTDLSSEDPVAEPETRVSPGQFVQSSIEDLYAAHSMSGLRLGDDSVPETDPKPEDGTSDGPGPSPDVSNPSAQQPLSSTPNKPLTEQPTSSDISATASSEQLGSTIPAATDSTMSVTGFESASGFFLG